VGDMAACLAERLGPSEAAVRRGNGGAAASPGGTEARKRDLRAGAMLWQALWARVRAIFGRRGGPRGPRGATPLHAGPGGHAGLAAGPGGPWVANRLRL